MRILPLFAALLALIAVPASARPASVEIAFDNGAGRTVPVTAWGERGRTRGVIGRRREW